MVLKSPTGGHHRTPSDISMISLDSSVSPDEKKEEGEEIEKEDQVYGRKKKTKAATAPPTASSMERMIKEAAPDKGEAAIRGFFGRGDFNEKLQGHKAVILQSRIRAFLVRKQYRTVMYGVVKIQGHFKRRKAKAELRQLKIEAKSVDHMKNVAKELENKIISLQQQLDQSKKVNNESRDKHEAAVKSMHTEIERLRATCEEGDRFSNRVTELEEEIRRLTKDLEQEKKMAKKFNKELETVQAEKKKMKEDLDAANLKLQEQLKSAGIVGAGEQLAWEEQKRQMLSEMDTERQLHQRLVKEHNRLLQRFENMQGEMQVLKSPTGGHHRTPSDISMISLDSSVSPDEEKEEAEEIETEDQVYGRKKKTRTATAPPTASSMERTIKEAAPDNRESPSSNVDIGLVLKLQNRVKALERERDELRSQLETIDEEKSKRGSNVLDDSAFNALKMQELENENDKLKREVHKLMEAITKSTNFSDKSAKKSAAGKELFGKITSKVKRGHSQDEREKAITDQFEAMTDELERRREECLQLRALLAERSISTYAVAKDKYHGQENIVDEDDERAMAYKSQRDIIRCLEDQLQKTELHLKKKTHKYESELIDLKKENDKQHKLIQQDLLEVIDKQTEQIRKLKKMLKVYAKRLKDVEAAEIQAELEQEETNSVKNVAQIKHRERSYMGMLEYKKKDEGSIIKALVFDLKPRVASGLMPGLPAYFLFMCVRHTDYINDDEKVRSFLTNSINIIKKAVKIHHDDLDRVTMLLANTCRFLHTLKQYSGEKQFQTENTPRQNEHCLRNFDLGEYRQVFSDVAVWIYKTLIKLMEATIQPSIVAGVLEHEAIAGLTGSKPGGMRGRTSSVSQETPEHSLDSLMKSMNHFVRILTAHAVDPELVMQIFRQLYYFLAASALNNLLLRKDVCNWSKGMQVRENLSHLEQWLRDNKLQESGAVATLDPIIAASQLLQARKTDADVDSVCDMCSNLTVPQIVKILNLYTPVDVFEERVPISFIRKLQEKLETRDNKDHSLLADLKFSFPVTFPFNPSKIALETIEVPEVLHLRNLVTRL